MDLFIEKTNHSPTLDMPYFGSQRRIFPFFRTLVEKYIGKTGVYAETNSGNCSNSYAYARDGYDVIMNDLSLYSWAIADGVIGENHDIDIPETVSGRTKKENDLMGKITGERPGAFRQNKDLMTTTEIAALCGAMVDKQGYCPNKIDFDWKRYQHYLTHINSIAENRVRAKKIFNMDLFDYLDHLYKESLFCDIIFQDFAWPWRYEDENESRTLEYESTVDAFSNLILGKKREFKAWSRHNILENVEKAVRKAQKVSRYVFLSNQSSNYPDSLTLEQFLHYKGFQFDRHTLTFPAEAEDNLGRTTGFEVNKKKFPYGLYTEFAYIIEGRSLRAY